MRDLMIFFRNFIKHPREISSVLPTSHAAAKRLAKRIKRPGRLVVVEYGPGTGVLARAILKSKRLSPDSKLILIEKTAAFVRLLRKKFTDPRVVVVHGSAENVGKILRAQGEKSADYIFSSIPLSIMSRVLFDRIIRQTRKTLKPDGMFIVFLFRHRVGGALKRHFPKVKMRFELFNIPPLFIFAASKKQLKPIETRKSGSRSK